MNELKLKRLQGKLIELKREQKTINDELKKVETEAKDLMVDSDMETFDTDEGKITLSSRMIATYPQEVKDQIERVKKKAEKDGKVEFKQSQYLRITFR